MTALLKRLADEFVELVKSFDGFSVPMTQEQDDRFGLVYRALAEQDERNGK